MKSFFVVYRFPFLLTKNNLTGLRFVADW